MAPAVKRRPPNAGKGRPKGVPNKTTKSAREAMELAFQGLGGVPQLTAWAKDNPTEFYKLWGRLIPTEMKHSGDPDQPIRHAIVKWGDVEIPI